MTAPTAPHEFPFFQQLLAMGTDEDFAALRALLQDSQYTVENVCRLLNVEKLKTFCAPPEGGRAITGALDAVVALFFDCSYVEESKLAAALPPGSIALLDRFQLLVRPEDRPGTVYAAAAILPVFGIFTACDRGAAPDGSSCEFPPDIVYPPVFRTTERFQNELPSTPCDAMLDLGTGTGIAALLGAPHARHVWATDITERSVYFAEFNRRLMGLSNVTVVQGDLFAAVEGLTFDRIVIHPPYVPMKIRTQRLVFADGGDDGEEIFRRTVQDLPRYLRPGGRFHSLQSATDREAQPLEQRIRQWLGPQGHEFDIVLGVHALRTPPEFLVEEPERAAARDAWIELWERTRTTHMVYAALLIERQVHPREDPITRRVKTGNGYTGADLARLMDWHKALEDRDPVEMLLNCRPLVPEENEIHIASRVRGGKLDAYECRIESPGPFHTSVKCEEWLTRLIPEFNGIKTWRQHYERAKRDSLIRAEISATDFARLLGLLVAVGAVKVPGWRPL